MPPATHRGYFAVWRSPEFYDLLRDDPDAFRLLILIASRARYREGFSAHGIGFGECVIGQSDVGRELKMSARTYRTAKRHLEKAGFSTFKTTTHGTIACLSDSRVFSVSQIQDDKPNDKQATSKRQASDKQATTNNKENKEKKENKDTPKAFQRGERKFKS